MIHRVIIEDLIFMLRHKGFEITPNDSYMLDIMYNRLATKENVDIKKLNDQVIPYILSKTKTPKAIHILAVFERQPQFKELLKGVREEAEEKNKEYEKLVEEIESYGQGN